MVLSVQSDKCRVKPFVRETYTAPTDRHRDRQRLPAGTDSDSSNRQTRRWKTMEREVEVVVNDSKGKCCSLFLSLSARHHG